jgi:hypothetical protein
MVIVVGERIPSTMSIFETTRTSHKDDLDAILRRSLKRAMLFHSMNERDLAAELTQRLGRTDKPIIPGLVNAWKAETKHRWHLPANLVPVICEILGDDTIQRLLLSEKLRQSLDLGESTTRIVAMLQGVLPKPTERKNGRGRKTLRRSNR